MFYSLYPSSENGLSNKKELFQYQAVVPESHKAIKQTQFYKISINVNFHKTRDQYQKHVTYLFLLSKVGYVSVMIII